LRPEQKQSGDRRASHAPIFELERGDAVSFWGNRLNLQNIGCGAFTEIDCVSSRSE
jgi:hypothetical protein